jgi:calcium/calmodulin-dependent protein kinase I
MEKFLSALKYLAEHKVVHRDLKPENLILATKGDDNDLRIADFGFATFLTEKEPLLYLRCGSPGYVGPEVLTDEGYGCAADVFSSGAIMYVLLTGK